VDKSTFNSVQPVELDQGKMMVHSPSQLAMQFNQFNYPSSGNKSVRHVDSATQFNRLNCCFSSKKCAQPNTPYDSDQPV
jgi:hypothetical protein